MRLRYDNAVGTLGASLTASGTTITFASAPAFSTLASGEYIPLALDPPSTGVSASFEIVQLTAYTAGATTGTIVRGQEGTTGHTHASGAVWMCAPTPMDLVMDNINTVATSGASQTLPDPSVFPYQTVSDLTLTANCTLTFPSPPSGILWNLTLLLRQDATGSRTVTWPTITWLGSGIAPTLQTAASSVDSVVVYTVDGGTTWFGVAQTSASGLRSGTTFPGSPASGDLFYRTDRRILYEYDSTSTHWLSLERKHVYAGGILNNTTSPLSLMYIPVFEDIYIERWATSTFVAGTNNGSNLWTVGLNEIPTNNVATSITSFSTALDTGSAWAIHNVSLAVIVAAASWAALLTNLTKTGTPGNIYLGSTLVTRSVG